MFHWLEGVATLKMPFYPTLLIRYLKEICVLISYLQIFGRAILEWWKIIDIFYLIMILQTINIYLVHLICIVKWIAKYHPTIFFSIFDLSEMLQFPSVLSTCLLSGVKISKFSCVIYLPLGDMVQWNSVTNIVYSQLPKWTWEMLDLALKGVYFKWSKPLLTSIISN